MRILELCILNETTEFSHIPLLGKWEIVHSELLLRGKRMSENKNQSESKGPCRSLSSGLGCKNRCTGLAVLPSQLTFLLSLLQTTLACSTQMVPWPAVAPTPSFPTTEARNCLRHHNCMRSHTYSCLFHPSPCFVHLAQIIQLSLPFSSTVHATYIGNSL